MTWTILGIPNCDQVRAARKWCRENGLEVAFRDIRKDPLTSEEWVALLEQDQGNQLINRRGPVYRKLDLKQRTPSHAEWAALLVRHPTLMKRPVLLDGSQLMAVGYKSETFAKVFKSE